MAKQKGTKGKNKKAEIIEDELPPSAVQSFEVGKQNAGGGDAFALMLFADNEKLRRQKREYKALVEQMEADTETTEEELEAWKELGESPKKVKQLLTEAEEAGKASSQATRDLRRAEAAKAGGFNADAMKQLAPDLEFEVRKVSVDGKDVQVPFVLETTNKDGKDVTEAVKFEDFVDRTPGLKAFENVIFADPPKQENTAKDSASGLVVPRSNGRGGGEKEVAKPVNRVHKGRAKTIGKALGLGGS